MNDDKFPIILKTLQLNTALDFDLYLRSKGNDSHFVLYRHKDHPFDEHTLHRLLDSGVDRLYVLKTERASYLNYAERHLNRLIGDRDMSHQEKASIIHDIATGIVDNLLSKPLTADMIERSHHVTDSTTKMASLGKEAIHELLRLMQTDTHSKTHATNVSMLSIALCLEIGVSNPKLVRAIGLAALLHDIGESHIDPKILNKTTPLLKEEQQILEDHPRRGALMLEMADVTNTSILDAVREHHERFDGSGYPYGLKGNEICLGARIIAIADTFDEMTSGHRGRTKQSTYGALTEIISRHAHEFDPNLVQHLILLLGPDRKAKANAAQAASTP